MIYKLPPPTLFDCFSFDLKISSTAWRVCISVNASCALSHLLSSFPFFKAPISWLRTNSHRAAYVVPDSKTQVYFIDSPVRHKFMTAQSSSRTCRGRDCTHTTLCQPQTKVRFWALRASLRPHTTRSHDPTATPTLSQECPRQPRETPPELPPFCPCRGRWRPLERPPPPRAAAVGRRASRPRRHGRQAARPAPHWLQPRAAVRYVTLRHVTSRHASRPASRASPRA